MTLGKGPFGSLLAKANAHDLIRAGLGLSAMLLMADVGRVARITLVTLEAATLGYWAVVAWLLSVRAASKANSETRSASWHHNHLPGVVYRFVRRADGSGYFDFISDACLPMFGVTPEQAYADPESVLGQFDPDDRLELKQIMATAAERLETDWWCGRVKEGNEMKWVTITAKASVLPTGEPYWDGIVLDDTRRQQELVESKRFLDSVIENLPDMVFIKNADDLRFVFLNRAGEDLLGFDRSELIGKSDFDFFPEDQAQYFIDRDHGVLEGKEVVCYPSERITTRNRGMRLLHTKKIPILDAKGNPKFLLGISEDVTDRVLTEEALLESQHRLNAILNHTTTPILLQDEEGRVVLFNESALHMSGVGFDQILGRVPEEFMSLQAAAAYREAEAHVRATGESAVREEVFRLDNESRTFITIRFPVLDGQGTVYAVGTIATDITEREKIMGEVKRAKEDAEGANMAKNLFLSRMSHELRTPLNAILGFAQLLEFDELPPEQTDAVQFILSSGRHLLGLINEVLDISRIESGSFSVSMEPVQIQEVVQEALMMVRPAAEAHGIKIRVEEIDSKLYFKADRQRVSQAVINLLSNAVKYNRPSGSVEVSFHVGADGEGSIHVLDTGVGIAPDKRDRLFVPFDRLGAESTGVEGTGLGLSLSRRLVEVMHGEMGLLKSDGEGSVFFIRLPMTAQPCGVEETFDSATVWRKSA